MPRGGQVKHGLAVRDLKKRHPLYRRWVNIRQRCNNPNHPRYKDYGGRGITVAPEFADFKVFFDYVMALPEAMAFGRSLDRIDNNRGYIPGNIRWSTAAEQRANQYREPWPFGVLRHQKTQGFEAEYDAWAQEQEERELYELSLAEAGL